MHRFLIVLVVAVFAVGCRSVDTASQHSLAAKYSTEATLTQEREGGSYELLVRVSRLSEQDGKVTEKVIALPRLKILPGVPVVPLYPGLKVPGSFPFASDSNGTRGVEEDVSVDVAWEGEQSNVPVCTVTVKLREKIVSKTKVTINAKELAATDVSGDPPSAEEQRPFSVTTNEVVLIKAASGAVAVIHFTRFGPDTDTASYRWRFRRAKSQPIVSGQGQVREFYNRERQADGSYVVTTKADHDTIVRAGDFRVEWSYGSTTNGWLYHPTRATLQVLASDSFDRDL